MEDHLLIGIIRQQLNNCFTEARFPKWETCFSQGKVRDIYKPPGSALRVLISTDRQSALDRVLCAVPFKGQTLNTVALFWFDQTRDIVPNHVLNVTHPNVMVVRELQMLPVEVVVRAYLTGSSGTAIWTHYKRGVRDFYGHIRLPDGMRKNDPLSRTVVTPTTKYEEHDRNLHEAEIVGCEMVPPELWKNVKEIALKLFARGVEIAARQGLILVDTKYEMGLDPKTGVITLADEIHTPDSSRFWLQETYEQRHAAGEEPESLDKEFLRLYLQESGFTGNNLPDHIPDDVRIGVSQRCIRLCELITGQEFKPATSSTPIIEAIRDSILPYFG